MASRTGVRRFKWQDLEHLTVLFNEINCLSNSERAYDVELMRQVLSQPSCQPEENGFLAESERSPVGFVLVSPERPIGRAVASGGVLRSHRNQGIGRSLVRTAIERARTLNAAVLHVQVPSDSADARHLLSTEEFLPVKTYWQMRWDGDEIPSVGLPPVGLPQGFSLRPFVRDRDEDELTRLQNAAFEHSWGFSPNTVEEIGARVRLERSDTGGIIFVVDGSRLSAYNWTMIASNDSGSTGWIAMTGVHPDYRGRGLGRAVVVTGLEHLKARGVDGVELEVDSENVPARDLYLGLGFRKLRENVWYERRLRS